MTMEDNRMSNNPAYDTCDPVPECEPERRSKVTFFGALNLERIELYPYTSFNGDVGFTVRRATSDQSITVHLAIGDARDFSRAILDIVERHEEFEAAERPGRKRGWALWRFRSAR